MQRHEFKNGEELARELARKVAGSLDAALSAKGAAMLAVSGGSTPGEFFKELSTQDISWENVTVTLVDERFVEPANPRSNMGLVARLLLQDRAATAGFQPLYAGENISVEEAADAADATFRELGAPDACILGMGTDGHTASFFPGGDNLAIATDVNCPRRVVAMNAPGSGEPRLTLTLPMLMNAGFLALHIEGEEKRAVLTEAEGQGPISALPVRSVLRNAEERLQLYWAP